MEHGEHTDLFEFDIHSIAPLHDGNPYRTSGDIRFESTIVRRDWDRSVLALVSTGQPCTARRSRWYL